MVGYTGTIPEPMWSTKTETPIREQIVRFSTEDRGNVTKDDMQRLLDKFGLSPAEQASVTTAVRAQLQLFTTDGAAPKRQAGDPQGFADF